MKIKSLYIIVLLFAITMVSCEDKLEEEIFSELSLDDLLQSEAGMTKVLNSSYSYAHRSGLVQMWAHNFMNEMPTGETWGEGGSIESLWVSQIDFNWNSTHDHVAAEWNVYYNSIRDANIVLDNLDNPNFSEEFKTLTQAEAHFLRGWDYSQLYNLYGRLPLYTSTTDDPLQSRSTDEETRSFIEQELLLSIPDLPVEPSAFGKASKGAAMAVLCKFYLNTKQWQKAADMAQSVMALNKYSLLPNYSDVFNIANEGHSEAVWTLPKNPASGTSSQAMNALTFAPDYPLPFGNNSVYAAKIYLFDEFVNSFEASDTRANQIITEYVSTSTGETVVGLGNDKSHPYKYPWDPNANGAFAGNDVLEIRYSDILLSRAEALNEISGPTQEIIDLINDVKERAGATPLSLTGQNQTSLRTAILQEREWEFFFEGKAREDQIRHGVFISRAQARGKNASEFRKLYPIPQAELDANSLIEQNPGY